MVSPAHPTPSDLTPRRALTRRAAFELPAIASSVREARDQARMLLDEWGFSADVGDDVLLVVSELVTNVITHTSSQWVLFRLYADGRRVRVEVEDQDQREAVPERQAPDLYSQCGRGLVLVDALAHEWGVTSATRGPGHLVWAELRPDGPP
ncbi:ATP-binding protein [Streptomyces sp. NPDC059063]|uniref:ATP-binding protein n=1 Tax=unclassified Streptomyces TaxID=2593676 RepID=UPI0036D0EF15